MAIGSPPRPLETCWRPSLALIQQVCLVAATLSLCGRRPLRQSLLVVTVRALYGLELQCIRRACRVAPFMRYAQTAGGPLPRTVERGTVATAIVEAFRAGNSSSCRAHLGQCSPRWWHWQAPQGWCYLSCGLPIFGGHFFNNFLKKASGTVFCFFSMFSEKGAF